MGSDQFSEGVPFNMGIATLERIHNLILLVTKCRWLAIPQHYIRSLWLLLTEVYPFLEEAEKQQAILEYLKLNRDVSFHNAYNYNFITSDRYFLWMKDMLKDKGLLMAQSEGIMLK